MTDTIFGWSGLAADGKRIFVRGPQPAATKLTSTATYASRAAYAAAIAADTGAATPLAKVQAVQVRAIDAACAASIAGGFVSSALGAPHRYGSGQTARENLDADMMEAQTDPTVTATIACSADAGATWGAVVHTAAQIAQAWKDFRAFRIACQAKNRALQAQVLAATTPAAVAAIVWG